MSGSGTPVRGGETLVCETGIQAVLSWLRHFTGTPENTPGTVFYALDQQSGDDSVVLHCEGTSDVAMTVDQAKILARWLYQRRVDGCGALCLELCRCIDDIEKWGRTRH